MKANISILLKGTTVSPRIVEQFFQSNQTHEITFYPQGSLYYPVQGLPTILTHNIYDGFFQFTFIHTPPIFIHLALHDNGIEVKFPKADDYFQFHSLAQLLSHLKRHFVFNTIMVDSDWNTKQKTFIQKHGKERFNHILIPTERDLLQFTPYETFMKKHLKT